MNFINKIKNSFYNPAFYSGLKEQKLSFSFKYFFSLVVVLSVIVAFVIGIKSAPFFTAENLRNIADFYPKELTVEIKDGLISTNAIEPYIIKDSDNALSSRENRRANWLVIDTKSDFSIEAFKSYDTQVLVGKNFVVTTKNTGQFEFNDLSKMPNFTLSYEKILHWVDLIASKHLLISLGLFAMLFIGFFGFFIVKLIGLLIIALLIMVIGRIKKVPLSYKDSYKVGLHAMTAPLILQTILILLGVSVSFPFFFSLLLLLVVFVNLKKSENIFSESPKI